MTPLAAWSCWRCGEPAGFEIPTGPPEHRWRAWCRSCWDAWRNAGYREPGSAVPVGLADTKEDA